MRVETAMGRIQRVLRARRGDRAAGCHHKHDVVALLDGYEPMHALVAEQGDQLLGLTHFIFHRSTTSLGPVCYLQDLFTVEASRGRGVGRALIEEIYRRAVDAGCSRVYWNTHKTNATAMKLYDTMAEESGFLVYRKAL